jgi:hemolysin-activating ACP:hemolysin acyltransferase
VGAANANRLIIGGGGMAFFTKKPPEPPASRQAPARAAPNGKAPEIRNGASARPMPAKAPAQTPPTAEEVKEGVERARKTLVALGEVISVLMRSAEYRAASLATVKAMVGPPIASGQFMVLSAHDRARGMTAPTALAMWANVSDEVDRRLSEGKDSALKPEEWTGGKNSWLVVLAGDQRMLPTLLNRVRETALKGRSVKMRVKDKDGKMALQTLPPLKAQPEKRAT